MSSFISAKTNALISFNEGLRLTPYRCDRGFLTIGYGLNIDAGISKSEAQLLRDHRINLCVEDLSAYPYWESLSAVRKAVLVDMHYQLGAKGFSRFVRMGAALIRGDYERAADEIMDSAYARQVPVRASRNEKMMRENVWSAVVLAG